ncbi:ribosomal RNA-processing protein 14-like [Contarinia nasturtii]|uniref:ribosomal RNA-processing protein 14-like n=1 Tax=Contarinia nasturtii TaxID=265458 RepID=UPI0012D3C4B6|nr:ribosomal RNA-processing protein 14-like [Contarinia nasturtii]
MSNSDQSIHDLLAKAISGSDPTVVDFSALRELLQMIEKRLKNIRIVMTDSTENGQDEKFNGEMVVAVTEYDEEQHPETTETDVTIEEKNLAKKKYITKLTPSEVKSPKKVKKQTKEQSFEPKPAKYKPEEKSDKKKKALSPISPRRIKHSADEKVKMDTVESQSNVEEQISTPENETEKEDVELTHQESVETDERTPSLNEIDLHLNIDETDDEDRIALLSEATSIKIFLQKDSVESADADERSLASSLESKPQEQYNKDDIESFSSGAAKIEKVPRLKRDFKAKANDLKDPKPKQKRLKEITRSSIPTVDKSSIPPDVKSSVGLKRRSKIRKLPPSAETLNALNKYSGMKEMSSSDKNYDESATEKSVTLADKIETPKQSRFRSKCDKMTQTCPLDKTEQKCCKENQDIQMQQKENKMGQNTKSSPIEALPNRRKCMCRLPMACNYVKNSKQRPIACYCACSYIQGINASTNQCRKRSLL